MEDRKAHADTNVQEAGRHQQDESEEKEIAHVGQ